MKFCSLPALQAPNLKIIQGSITTIDSGRKVATIKTSSSGREEGYDYLVAASGLRRVFPVVPQSVSEKDYLQEAKEQIERSKVRRKRLW
jgi:NADH dehydrogenase FAD-containing subunit